MSSTTAPPAPHAKPWETANPWISGILAFLVPGAGHLYQGRIFKGIIYLVCIHAAFFTGMCLGEGMTVHYKVAPAGRWRNVSLSYAAQFGTGIWALPAVWQARRVDARENHRAFSLTAPFSAPFTGELEARGPGNDGATGPVSGTITLEPAEGPSGLDVKGTFTGKLRDRPVELALAGGFEMDKPIGASAGRLVQVRVERQPEDHPNLDLALRGTIPRPLWNWYEVPPDTPQLQEITGRLGKYFELALVFTWIAGLLNVLAVWDCVKGPSLGFGDERPAEPAAEPQPAESSKAEKPAEPPKPAAPPPSGPPTPSPTPSV